MKRKVKWHKRPGWHIGVHVRGMTMGSYLEPFLVSQDGSYTHPVPLFGGMDSEAYETKEDCEKAIAFIGEYVLKRRGS